MMRELKDVLASENNNGAYSTACQWHEEASKILGRSGTTSAQTIAAKAIVLLWLSDVIAAMMCEEV